MKRTALARSKPMRRGAKRSRYARRHRDTAFMAWTKRQPCVYRGLGDPCDGPIEADHSGARGLGRKADDRTCLPACVRHHREPGAVTLRLVPREERRAWRDQRIAEHHARYLRETGATP